MNSNIIYDIFKITEEEELSDLNVGVAMLKVKELISDNEDKEIREFIGKHYMELVDSYKYHNRDIFSITFEQCKIKDEENIIK